MNNKFFKIVFIITAFLTLIIFIIEGFYKDKKGRETFIQESYHGIINDIVFFEGNRGFPLLKINNNWHTCGILESKIQNYIKVGDSISKNSGREEIKVYRKNINGNLYEKVFK